MRRVVISGLGVISCLGNSQDEVVESLRAGRSGISFNEGFKEMGLRSQVCGSVDLDVSEHIDRKVRRFMGDAAAYSYLAMQQAIEDAGLDDADISNPRTGLIAASGGASSANIVGSADILRQRGVRKIQGIYACLLKIADAFVENPPFFQIGNARRQQTPDILRYFVLGMVQYRPFFDHIPIAMGIILGGIQQNQFFAQNTVGEGHFQRRTIF